MLTVLAGIAAGFVHVLSGPDHLAAVAPLAAERPRRSWVSGIWWGLGHTAGVLVVGGAALSVRELLPVEAISSWSEWLVGVALIALGLWGLRRAVLRHWHTHRHDHEGVPHVHIHHHPPGTPHEEKRAHTHAHLSVAFGTLHGLAGSAHVLGVLPAVAMPGLAGSLAYLAAFGAGSIAAMGAYGWIIGGLMRRLGAAPFRWALTGASCAALVVGVAWLAF